MGEEMFMMVLTYELDQSWWSADPIHRQRIVNRLRGLLSGERGEPHFRRGYRIIRSDSDFMFWLATKEPASFAEFKQKVMEVSLGLARAKYSMFSVYRDSPYLKPGMALSQTLESNPLKYLVAYPMSKDPEWYLLDFEERKRIMAEHIGIARSHPLSKGVRSYTTYSFGIDDQEFVVIYEVEDIAAWSAVTERLREVRARKWITNEAPILVGVLTDFAFLEPEEGKNPSII